MYQFAGSLIAVLVLKVGTGVLTCFAGKGSKIFFAALLIIWLYVEALGEVRRRTVLEKYQSRLRLFLVRKSARPIAWSDAR